jgi:hypothetical protein
MGATSSEGALGKGVDHVARDARNVDSAGHQLVQLVRPYLMFFIIVPTEFLLTSWGRGGEITGKEFMCQP